MGTDDLSREWCVLFFWSQFYTEWIIFDKGLYSFEDELKKETIASSSNNNSSRQTSATTQIAGMLSNPYSEITSL